VRVERNRLNLDDVENGEAVPAVTQSFTQFVTLTFS
jgi:hypothetical protein